MSAKTLGTTTYLLAYLALLVLTAVTVLVARVDLGAFGLPVALGIAGVKVMVVGLWFMNLRHGQMLDRVYAAAGVFWLVVLLALTLIDVFSRSTV